MKRRLRFHPAAQILAWCLLVMALQVMTPSALLTATCSVVVCALALSRARFMQLVRRTRWIMVSLLAIFAYTTPGKPLADALGMASPTLEGLFDGAAQLARLVAALASLALMLERLHRRQLIAGLYTLLAPLPWLGISRERIAVRLALTLHYAEAVISNDAPNLRQSLRSLFDSLPEADGGREGDAVRQAGQATGICAGGIELPSERFAASDMLLLGSAVFIVWLALG